MSISTAICNLKKQMMLEGIEQEKGLGLDLFLFSSTLAPVVNVDLLVTNEAHQILLSWRDDAHAGTGWHIPGGCIRFRETMQQRIQETALKELGSGVVADAEPLKVFEIFSPPYRDGVEDQRERAHFITLSFHCVLPSDYFLNENPDSKSGMLKWFDGLPEDLIDAQSCYKECWEDIERKLWEKK